MEYTEIKLEYAEQVGVITLNAPKSYNALTKTMVYELGRAVDDAATTCRALIITGAGNYFCSGASLDPANPLSDIDPDPRQRDIGKILDSDLNPLMLKLSKLPIPWLTAVRGGAAGFGASLALAGDLILAAEGAEFAQAFSGIGLVPDGGSSHLLVRTIGRVRANELMLLGGRLPAKQAMEWGLINRVVDDSALLNEALSMAKQLADGPSVALGMIRQIAWHAVNSDFQSTLQKERECQLLAGRTQDFEEALSAFAERRKPAFQGR